VKDQNGQPLTGATITAVHTPSGTTYRTISGKSGIYNLPNLRVGGPYQVTISFVGFGNKVFDDLYLTLGTPLSLNADLSNNSGALSEVVVSTNRNGLISPKRNGASTNISTRQMQTLPTINRSVQDFVRLTPQAATYNSGDDGSTRGISFGGQNNRYNQFSIDGANATDAFGLTASGTNGGQANVNPISIEAIQEMQVVLSPYDVTQGGFTGGGINAVTKSGSNQFHGAVYGFGQNEKLVGKSVLNNTAYPKFTNSTYGASLGGAIIKNKLFFYANGERYERSTPLPYDPTQAGSGSKFDAATLEDLRQYLIKTYNYDPGTYGNINKENYSTSFFGRIDWNINDKNKLTVRHNYVSGSNDIISRSATSMTYSNGGYKFKNITNSTVVELNSNISSSASNVLRLTYNNIADKRATPFFPTLTIQNGSLTYNLGSDNSSQVNSLDQNIYSLTDNFTLYKGKHTFTFGTNNEFYHTVNAFLQNYYGNYNFGGGNSSALTNIDDFKAGKTPYTYNVGYSTKGGSDKALAVLNAAQLGIYAQDAYTVSDRFRVVYGLRVDMPVYFNKPAANTQFDTAAAYHMFNVRTEQMPTARLMFSPRVGFNWDVKGDATTQFRGGAGLFTGRIPFVWISNQFSNTGVTNIGYFANAAAASANDIHFNYNPNDIHAGAFIPSSTTPAATTINVINKNFKFPQVFRANLALDQKLPIWGLIGTLEGVFTKTVNNVNYQNLNLTYFPDSTVKLGANEVRPYWTKRVNSSFNDVIELNNTSKGYSYNLTAQLQKPFTHGWSGMVAYTYGHSTSLTDLTSSVAYSNWRFAYATRGLNNLDLATSNFDLGSRIIGTISKEFRYAKRFATTITLVYTGQSGQPISYLYSKTITGDDLSGATSNTLAYVPKNQAEANFVAFNRTVNNVTSSVSPAQQWADFQMFVLGNPYLKSHIGQNTERNGDRLPFENHFDVRIAEDINIVKGHKLQITFDIVNVTNMLNNDWGRSYNLSNQSINLFTVVNNSNKPTFNFDITKFGTVNGNYKPYFISDYTSRWNAQLGLRYSF
jgi:hypothetical protein